MDMVRNVILLVLGLVAAGVLYVSWGTIETVATMALTANDLYAPNVEKPKPVAAAATSGASHKRPPLTGIAQQFSNSLMILDDNGNPKAVDSARLTGVKYWAFYYSASWCPPCRAFTPVLVDFYRSFKPSHPNFELIFVNDDHSESAMLSYMKTDSMPWPAVWYADIDNPELQSRKYCGPGIPCLVLVDDDGRVLSDSFANGEYTGPNHVIDDIRAVVK